MLLNDVVQERILTYADYLTLQVPKAARRDPLDAEPTDDDNSDEGAIDGLEDQFHNVLRRVDRQHAARDNRRPQKRKPKPKLILTHRRIQGSNIVA